MRKIAPVLLTLALAGCSVSGEIHHVPGSTDSAVSREAETQADRVAPRETPLPPPDRWLPVDGGRVHLTGWHWQDPDLDGRQPRGGAWLVVDVEVQATTAPVYVSLWQWKCLGAYDGELSNAVATPLHDVWAATVPTGVSSVGSVACDPNPGQAVIVQWSQPDPQASQPSWLVPPRDN